MIKHIGDSHSLPSFSLVFNYALLCMYRVTINFVSLKKHVEFELYYYSLVYTQTQLLLQNNESLGACGMVNVWHIPVPVEFHIIMGIAYRSI